MRSRPGTEVVVPRAAGSRSNSIMPRATIATRNDRKATTTVPGVATGPEFHTADVNAFASDPFFDEVPFIIACASTFKAKKVRSLLIKRKCVIYSNLEEASAILGRKMACSTKAANSLFALGAREAIVTNGKNKVSCRSVNGLATHIPTLAINSKITGAGDTFLAVHLLSKLVNNKLSEQTHLQIADSKAYQKIVN